MKKTLQMLIVVAFLGLSAKAQFIQLGSKLVGTGGSAVANQGFCVAISADGNTAIVGGPTDNSGVGAAWVYTRSGNTWSQQGNKLVGTGAVGTAGQGSAVSISADGNTAIITGDADSSYAGAAWVFVRSSGVWTQQGNKLVGSGSSGNAEQGYSVSISSDGNTAIVGGMSDNNSIGASWIFIRNGNIWSQQGNKLVGTNAVGMANQGWFVSISSDGNTAMVGGDNDNNNIGAVWVFTRSSGIWTQQGNKLIGIGAIGNAAQGFSVALSPDGNTAIEGGISDNNELGASWVFTRSAGVWAQQGNKLVGSGSVGTFSFEGNSVSLSYSGDTAIIGGNDDNSNIGALWVFIRTSGIWTQQGNKLIGTGAIGAAFQGRSCAISSDGLTAIVGGDHDNSMQGAAWIFSSGSSGINEIKTTNNISIYPNPATTLLHIHHSTCTSQETLVITDLLGTEVYKEKLCGIDNTISISSWSVGLYFYEVRSNTDIARGKFVKE